MATKMEHLELEVNHFNHFMEHLPGIDGCCRKTIDVLLNMGILQVSTAFEHALANTMGLEVVSHDSNDLSNGADAKLSSVRTSSNGRRYSAPVTNIKGKTGNLLVQVFERKLNKFYNFVIPHESYKHIPPTSNIEIPFELDGTPRRDNKCSTNWWDYEVDSLMA
jgi:hypothetical protein